MWCTYMQISYYGQLCGLIACVEVSTAINSQTEAYDNEKHHQT